MKLNLTRPILFFMVFSIGMFIAVAAQTPKLPTFAKFKKAYPMHCAYMTKQLVDEIGGRVQEQYKVEPNENACALRVSTALNDSGLKMRVDGDRTYSGIDKKNYYLGADHLIDFLMKNYAPTIEINLTDKMREEKNIKSTLAKLGNREGIYAMIPVDAKDFGASGHIDLFYNFKDEYKCEGSCYTKAAAKIYFWELPK